MTKALTHFENELLKEYRRNGFRMTRAYLRLKPHCQYTTAKTEASKLFNRPHIQEELQRLAELPVQTESPGLAGSLPSPASPSVTKTSLIEDAQRITRKAEADKKWGSALKGVELCGRFTGSFDGDQNESDMYMQFFQKVSVTVNLGGQEERRNEPIDITPDITPDADTNNSLPE